ncbi:MAG: hypothetical protein VB137_05590 [Burkholderia sp.]
MDALCPPFACVYLLLAGCLFVSCFPSPSRSARPASPSLAQASNTTDLIALGTPAMVFARPDTADSGEMPAGFALGVMVSFAGLATTAAGCANCAPEYAQATRAPPRQAPSTGLLRPRAVIAHPSPLSCAQF